MLIICPMGYGYLLAVENVYSMSYGIWILT